MLSQFQINFNVFIILTPTAIVGNGIGSRFSLTPFNSPLFYSSRKIFLGRNLTMCLPCSYYLHGSEKDLVSLACHVRPFIISPFSFLILPPLVLPLKISVARLASSNTKFTESLSMLPFVFNCFL